MGEFVMRAILLAGFAVAVCGHALAAEPRTYVCVEDRSVGWERRDNQPDAVGQFQPDQAPMIIKVFPAVIEGDKALRLGRIEVTKDGRTSTYSSTKCDSLISEILSRGSGPWHDIDYQRAACARQMANFKSVHEFGAGLRHVSLYGAIDTGDTTITYTDTLIGASMAYAQRGTCTAL